MKNILGVVALSISFSTTVLAETTIKDMVVECSGDTTIEVPPIIGAQTPFWGIFSIKGNVVEMVEGDNINFSQRYTYASELSLQDRPGFGSKKGNIFFFVNSGRFKIFKMDLTKRGNIRTETTTGNCVPYVSNAVFKQ